METTVLIGAENVSRAGHEMARAAETIWSAASGIQEVLLAHQRFLGEWLKQFEVIVTDALAKAVV